MRQAGSGNGVSFSCRRDAGGRRALPAVASPSQQDADWTRGRGTGVGRGEKNGQSPGRSGHDRQWSRPLSRPTVTAHCHATPQVLGAFHPVDGQLRPESTITFGPGKYHLTALLSLLRWQCPSCAVTTGHLGRWFPIPSPRLDDGNTRRNSHFCHEMQKPCRTSCCHFRRRAPTPTPTPTPTIPAPPQSPPAAPNSFFAPSAPRTP